MIPSRRDGMTTEIALVIQTLLSVHMIALLISRRRDPGITCRDLAKAGRVNTSSQLGGMN